MKNKMLRYGAPALVCLAVVMLATVIWPGVLAWRVALSFAVLGALTALAWRACAWRSYAGAMLLLTVLTLLLCGVVINVNYYTLCSGGSLTHPVLLNTDAYEGWWAGVALIAEDVRPNYFVCYPTYLILILFARDIFLAILPGVMSALLTLVAVGELTWRLTGRRDMALTAMVAMSTICYFLVQATVLIKDVPLTLAMTLMGLGLVRLVQGSRHAGITWTFLAASVVITATYRPNMLFFYVLGAAIFAVRRRPEWRLGLIAAAAVGAWLVVDVLVPGNPHPVELALGAEKLDFVEVKTMAWDNVAGNYSSFPVWKKLCLLPASMVLQFLIPFPWNWARDTIFGPTVAVAHFGFPWYLAGGVFLYWLFTQMRRSPELMVRLAIWAAILYTAIAYSYNGRISRYYMPEIPLIMPAVAFTLITAWRQRRFRVWMAVFCGLMALALLVCHYLHTRPV